MNTTAVLSAGVDHHQMTPSRARLGPHSWDDEEHRAVIHAAFDKWFIAHEQHGCSYQATAMRHQLRRLVENAAARLLLIELAQTQERLAHDRVMADARAARSRMR